jgi:hypothetical protein
MVANHVAVELRDGERGQTVPRGVKEAFFDQAGACRGQLFRGPTQYPGYVQRLLRPGPRSAMAPK